MVKLKENCKLKPRPEQTYDNEIRQGARLYVVRHNLTQAALAKELGVCGQTVCDFLGNPKHRLSETAANKLVAILQADNILVDRVLTLSNGEINKEMKSARRRNKANRGAGRPVKKW